MPWSPNAVKVLYPGTSHRSPARRLVVDLYALLGRSDWLEGMRARLPQDFMYDIALRMIELPRSALDGMSPTLALEYRDETADEVKLIGFSSAKGTTPSALGSAQQSKPAHIPLFGSRYSGGLFGPGPTTSPRLFGT
jgi:hypothetical protein